MTDRQLLQAYQGRRDAAAFTAFVSRHESALLSFAAAFLRDETTAQDVVQDTFLRVARDPKRLLESKNLCERNWLLKVVRDLSVDILRRRASERKAIQAAAQTAPRHAAGPEALAEAGEHLDQVHAAIDRLEPRLRELLILKVREQKSYKEIAGITGLSVTHVGVLLHEALKALRGCHVGR